MSQHRTVALSVVAGLALVASVATATPTTPTTTVDAATASAATARTASFNLQTGRRITSGRAHALGRISFPTPTTVRVRGKFDDRCSTSGGGDGYAAYFEMLVVLKRAPTVRGIARDERGCTRAPLKLVFDQEVPREIDHVILRVLESKPKYGAYSYEDIVESSSVRIDR